VLSKPKLVVTSGKEANLLVGGEIPVTETTTTSGGNVATDVTFKDYGVGLNIKPTIIGGNKINVNLRIEVSDVDSGNSVGGNPAFTSRNTESELVLNDGQTVVFAGLIKKNEGDTVTKVPFLGDIPLVGLLFRKKTIPSNTETELVIMLTPTILRQEEHKSSDQYGVSTAEIKTEPKDQKMVSSQMSSPASIASIGNQAMMTQTYVPQEVVPYARIVQQKIAQRVIYPEKARRYGWQGTVKLALHLLGDGSLASATIRESSGYDLFDRDALNVAKDLAPYSGFPAETGLQDLTLTIPIVYSLETNY